MLSSGLRRSDTSLSHALSPVDRDIDRVSEIRAHGNEILNILEGRDLLAFFQHDKDWFYRSEERRWITMNDNSSWRRIERVGGKLRRGTMHMA